MLSVVTVLPKRLEMIVLSTYKVDAVIEETVNVFPIMDENDVENTLIEDANKLEVVSIFP